MGKKLEKFWNSLDRSVIVNKRELVLGVAACTLAGILMGMLLSPRKTVTIGSNNGNNNTGNSAGRMTGDEEEKPEDTSSGEEARED